MSAREIKARDEQTDTIAMIVGSSVVGAFLIGSLIWWPGAVVALSLGAFATLQTLRTN